MKNKLLNIIGMVAVILVALTIMYYTTNKKGKDMSVELSKNDTELQNTKWNLGTLYSDISDPQIEKDIIATEKLCGDFLKFKGKLKTDLPNALDALIQIDKLSSTIGAYLYMRSSTDNENQEIKKIMSMANERLSRASANMAFFDIEIGEMPTDDYNKLLKNSVVMKHKSMLDDIRKNKKYLLTEKEEILLSHLSPFGGGEWDDMLDEMESGLNFEFNNQKLKLSEILEIMNYDPDADKRHMAMKTLNDTLKDTKYSWMRTRALNLIAGEKNTMDQIRGYSSVMKSRNISNNLDDEVVDALHKSVQTHGKDQLQRYYKIMSRVLGREKLLWSDRNANVPSQSNEYISWSEMKNTVMQSYSAFSPKMAEIAQKMFDENHIDAPIYAGKSSGAYSYTIISVNGQPQSFILLNTLGNDSSVKTLSHELGHSVHGILAGAKQSPLTFHAPMAYAETASIFGEMLTFEYMLSMETDPQKRFSMLMNKSKDWINTVARQISFSLFEQQLHEQRKSGKLSADDMNRIWLNVSQDFYGDQFEYVDMENLWSYVGHFMRPFYVYSYSFGELFVQSLFAQKDNIPDFEKKYIEMLESGGTKNAVELMAPFGLDPRDPEFWNKGIDASITKWLDQAEQILQENNL